MESFYGGREGQSFYIKEYFDSYYGTGDGVKSIENDLSLGWASSIGDKEFVVIRYGQTSDPRYDEFRKRDEDRDGKSYNSTLWQKVYNEVTGINQGGYTYKFISQMTGNTPAIDIEIGEPLDVNQMPTIDYDRSNVDNPQLTLHLPQNQILDLLYSAIDAGNPPTLNLEYEKRTNEQGVEEDNPNRPIFRFELPKSQVLHLEPLIKLPANGQPTLELKYKQRTNADGNQEDDPNNPTLEFSLPVSQVIDTVVLRNPLLNPGEAPTVNLVVAPDDSIPGTEKATITNPVLVFQLPAGQKLSMKDLVVLDANEAPQLSYDDTTDPTKPTIEISLPQQEITQKPTIESIDVGSEPNVELKYVQRELEDGSFEDDPNKPYYHFSLPLSQAISILFDKDADVLDANQAPYIELGYEQRELEDGSFEDDPNKRTIRFKLPQSQVITKTHVDKLNAGETPTVEVDTSGENGINQPTLNFGLPTTQKFTENTVTSETLDADKEPSVEYSEDEPYSVNEPGLKIKLPQSQVMQQPELKVVGPAEDPNVQLSWAKRQDSEGNEEDDPNKPKLDFSLPRAVKFYWGSELGERDKQSYTITNPADCMAGDYYINVQTGFVYRVVSVNAPEITLTYQACLQAPLPTLKEPVTALKPYDANGEAVDPVVSQTVSPTGWELDFQLPKVPKFDTDFSFVGSTEPGNVDVSIRNQDTIILDFDIPAGARIRGGNVAPVVSVNDRVGDMYVNSETGDVYQLGFNVVTDVREWNLLPGKLKGPTGDSLKIVGQYNYTNQDGSLENGVQYIRDQLAIKYPDGYNYRQDEIFALTWASSSGGSTITYWYYCIDPSNPGLTSSWGRAQLTGNTANLIEDSYYSGTDSKAYSTKYINGLINNTQNNKDKEAYTKEQSDELSSWGTWDSNGSLFNSKGEKM